MAATSAKGAVSALQGRVQSAFAVHAKLCKAIACGVISRLRWYGSEKKLEFNDWTIKIAKDWSGISKT